MVRPLPGIYEQLSRFKKRNGIFYNWAELRDLARLGTYEVSYYSEMTDHNSDSLIVKHAIEEIKKRNLDFSFVYLGETDEFGHNFGWMSPEYLKSVNHAIDLIDEIMESFPDHHIIITADHGGHGRGHGTDIPEDMTIPLIFKGEEFKKNTSLEKASILDIAPTITDIIGVERAVEWEGASVFSTFKKK